MSRPVWYRSLYWRIAFGFIALLAVLLVAQVIVFLWLTDRIVGPSSRSPEQLAANIAQQISRDLATRQDVQLESYLRSEFGHIYQPFLVVLNDGRVGSNRPGRLPPGFTRGLIPRGRRFGGDGGRQGDGGRPGEPGRPGEGAHTGEPSKGEGPGEAGRPRLPGGGASEGGEGRGGRRRVESAAITVDGAQVGTVYVPSDAPPVFVAVWEVGPTLAWFALGVLGIGAVVTALAIFRPAHNRLRALEEAATALGQGRTDVRAVESGGDEVSSLARTFNRMAEDLDVRAKALAASDRARRQLLADVSHELMTPLTAIRGYTETLGMPDLPLDGATRGRYLEIIGEETQKLEELIGDLLDLARLEGGGGNFVFKKVTAAELFGRVLDRHGPTIRQGRIDVVNRIDPPDLTIWCDSQRLEQALQNLAANALRHTPEGGTVELLAGVRPDGVHLVVRDTGPGIPPEHLPRVFDRFYKVDPSRTTGVAPSGSGLGLSIVQAIVQRHGGRITAANAPGGGASFEITLPLAAGDRAA